MNDGKPLTNYEQGLVFVQLRSRGFKDIEISKRVGKSATHIHNCIEIASLPKAIQNEISAGNISGGTAVAVFKNANNEEEALALIKNTIDAAQKEAGGKTQKSNFPPCLKCGSLPPQNAGKNCRTAWRQQQGQSGFLQKGGLPPQSKRKTRRFPQPLRVEKKINKETLPHFFEGEFLFNINFKIFRYGFY